jgi:transposase
MAKRRISMRKIKEILRLIYGCKISQTKAADVCNVSRATVQDYVRRAKAGNVAMWPLQHPAISDIDLENLLFNDKKNKIKDTLDYQYLVNELRRPNVTMTLLWEEYKQNHSEGYQYAQFCVKLKKYLKTTNYSMRQIHKAGEKLFIDFGDGLNLTDPLTRETKKTQLFVMTWGASNYTFCVAVENQKLENWLNAHVKGLNYFGCCSRAMVPDNLKAGVTRACRYEPDVNPSYKEFAEHYNTTIFPARPLRPKDKAKVETSVKIAKRWILAKLRNHIFTTLIEMNKKIAELLEEFNAKKMQKTKKSRRELFEVLDKPHALPLPTNNFEFAEWRHAKVNINYHILFDKHEYSVPYTFVAKKLDIKATAKIIEIFYQGKRIISHIRSFKQFECTTKIEHMPKSHQKYLEWTPEKILEYATKFGEHVRELTELILISDKFPERAYRSCLGIIRLEQKFDKERLNAACRRALKYNNLSYTGVKNILQNGLDKQKISSEEKVNKIILHDNIRGQKYYSSLTGLEAKI